MTEKFTKDELLELLNVDDNVPDDEDGQFTDDAFTRICEDRERYLALSDVEQETASRWADVEALRVHYALFEDFLYDCMSELMGFECSELQIDIGRFLQSDVQHGMIQAQRSQAKSTIVAMFAVWQLIHDCKHRVLIVSAGSEVAAEIANWVIQIIMNWDILECLRPDRQHGDRASSKAFDINWQLKGPEKSPSVACIGITANMQGCRADLLIPDDIESSKNGTTEIQRAALEHLSKDFTSICQSGRIMYLGTPQTTDSIYKNLPDRGYTIRVWTGRYPNQDEARNYGETLAPYLTDKMGKDPSLRVGGGLDGSRGKPTDPVLLGEEALDKTSGEITWMPSPENQIAVTGFKTKPRLYRPFTVSKQVYEYEGKHMYVDTAGGGKNGDETVAAVTYFLHGYVFLAEILKLAGGYGDDKYAALSQLALKHEVNSIDVEKNFGFGAFAHAWKPILAKHYLAAGKEMTPRVEDVWESGQKELRIIDTLEPLMARHKLIIHEDIIQYDIDSAKKYPIDQQETYKFFHQVAKISRDRGALIHDDSIDAVAGSVRRWVDRISVDEHIRMDQKETDSNLEFFAEWGADIGIQSNNLGNMSDRFSRKQTKRHKR